MRKLCLLICLLLGSGCANNPFKFGGKKKEKTKERKAKTETYDADKKEDIEITTGKTPATDKQPIEVTHEDKKGKVKRIITAPPHSKVKFHIDDKLRTKLKESSSLDNTITSVFKKPRMVWLLF